MIKKWAVTLTIPVFASIMISGAFSAEASKPQGSTADQRIVQSAVSAVREILSRDLSTVLTVVEKEGDDKRFLTSDLYTIFMKNARDFNADLYTGTQDTSGFQVKSVEGSKRSPSEITVTALFDVVDSSPPVHPQIAYDMKLVAGRWKIGDIRYMSDGGRSITNILKSKK